MKILCVSDQIDPLVYSTKVKERFQDIDLVLCAGDLPSEYIDFIVSSLNKPTYFIFGNHNLSEFGLYHKIKQRKGAHPTLQDEKSAYDLEGSHGADYIGFKTHVNKKLLVEENGKKRPLLIAGVSGSIKYNGALSQYTNMEMMLYLLKMVPSLLFNKIRYGKYLDIFLTHASPRHIHDREDPCHIGFECFNWFIQKFAPTYLVHGHIHLYDMNEKRITEVETKNGVTSVVNAYSYVIIELPRKTASEEPIQ
nr:metallophosphoesterase [Treponema sp.]